MAAFDRDKALDVALAQIDKQYGKGAVMRLGDRAAAPIEVIPTGSIALDVALGIGGLPRGRVVEIYGPESSGKTTVALHAVANAQAAGGIAAFIDAEHALDPEYARALGVDTDALLVSQPDTGEQALEIMDMLIRSGAIDIIVIDSVAALVPRAEIEGEMGDSHVGLQARLMSQALRKITGALSNTGTTAIFINQLREKIGVMFGSPETTTGGKALKFYSSVRLDVRRIETLKDGADAVGNRTRVKVVKNKVAPPFKQAEFDIVYGQGISREGSLIDVGVEQGIVKKSGAWYTYESDQLGQGKENVRSFLRDNPDLADEIEKKIKEKLGIGARVDEGAPIDVVPARSTSERGLSVRADDATAAGRRRPRTRSAGPPGDPEEAARIVCLRLLDRRAYTPGRAGDRAAQARHPGRRGRAGARPVRRGRADRRRRAGRRVRPGPAPRARAGRPRGGAEAAPARRRRRRGPGRGRADRPRQRGERRARAGRAQAAVAGRPRPAGAGAPAGRHAGPQGLLAGAGPRRGPRGVCAERSTSRRSDALRRRD